MPPIRRTPSRQQYKFLLPLSQSQINTLVLMCPIFANDASSTVHSRSTPCLSPCQSHSKDFQSSLTTHQFPSEQHEVVYNQCLFTECSGPTTISSEVTNYDHTNGRFVLVTHASLANIILFYQYSMQKSRFLKQRTQRKCIHILC